MAKFSHFTQLTQSFWHVLGVLLDEVDEVSCNVRDLIHATAFMQPTTKFGFCNDYWVKDQATQHE